MPVQDTAPTAPDSSVDDQIRYLEEVLAEMEGTPAEPVPDPPEPSRRDADLRRAKALIDEAIALLRPHFPQA